MELKLQNKTFENLTVQNIFETVFSGECSQKFNAELLLHSEMSEASFIESNLQG